MTTLKDLNNAERRSAVVMHPTHFEWYTFVKVDDFWLDGVYGGLK